MSEAPWLTIVGLGEDGPEGLSPASLSALAEAEVIIGPPRHLSLLPKTGAERIEWPVPFVEGIARLTALKPRRTVALASGNPFWFGAGTSITRHLKPDEWRAFPGASTFALAAARLGWPLESTGCFGLHAAPLTRLRPVLAPGTRLIVLLRDAAAVGALAAYLVDAGFGASPFTVMQSLGGPRERLTTGKANALPDRSFAHPVCVAIELAGQGAVLPLASGRPDDWFENDGQITRRPVRALTLSALAPRPFEHLWDIGGGSGSIAIEWLLSHDTLSATSIEPRPDRAERIRANACRLGVDRLEIITGTAPQALTGLAKPDVIFVGGGLGADLLGWIATHLAGTRLVANAVTLETEALLLEAQAVHGGDLLRIDLSQAAPLGPRRGWKAAYPIVQWSVTL